MNGPEHYDAAEKLLARAGAAPSGLAGALVAQAQVHATLATAATTIAVAYSIQDNTAGYNTAGYNTAFLTWPAAHPWTNESRGGDTPESNGTAS